MAYRLQEELGGLGGLKRRRAGWKCGMECVIIFRLLVGGADLANGRERRGLARRLPSLVRIAAEGNFYVRQYVGVEGMLFF